MTAQWTLTLLVVLASACYAAWALLPMAARRAIAAASLALPLPAALAARMRTLASSTSGCGCSGCDRNPLAAPGDTARAAAPASVVAQPITLHRRPPR